MMSGHPRMTSGHPKMMSSHPRMMTRDGEKSTFGGIYLSVISSHLAFSADHDEAACGVARVGPTCPDPFPFKPDPLDFDFATNVFFLTKELLKDFRHLRSTLFGQHDLLLKRGGSPLPPTL